MAAKINLTAKQALFINEYMENGFNALAAVRVAYPDAKEDSYRSLSYRVRTSPLVDTEIKRRLALQLSMECITKDRFVKVLADIALDDSKRANDRISAIKTLADQCGWNAPVVQEVTQKVITIDVDD